MEGRQYGRGKTGGQVGRNLFVKIYGILDAFESIRNIGYYLWKFYKILDDITQVRDEYRTDFDSGRGGYGKIVQQKLETPDSLMWENKTLDNFLWENMAPDKLL